MVIHRFIKFKFNIAITPLPSGKNRKKRKKKKKRYKRSRKIIKRQPKIQRISWLPSFKRTIICTYSLSIFQNNNILNYKIFQEKQAQD